ncbi:4Fe-4S dicluster protein [Geothermobacter ehrlichii]|uniref:4Fe-4S dicluster protein n=1 Tax=Geothermobacter ehrlichii TaxID=213224 RepID=A0A5D3WFL4_9BACT|nr:4Fe-4S dicluster domain-containing protein [Geothermobacter ehrlichii]TYO96656.1 4Fe-4S dicluster protein [Geothermobacter ehrlichii]
MLKRLEEKDFLCLLERIAERWQLLVPQRMSDGSRLLLPWQGGLPVLAGPPLQRKPTEVFFPQLELLLELDDAGGVALPNPPEKPPALLGLDHLDLAGIAFLDRFFLSPPTDDAYLRRRRGALLVGVSGLAGAQGETLPPLEGECDLELILAPDGLLAHPHTARGTELLEGFAEAAPDKLAALDRNATELLPEILLKAARLLQEERVPEDFWEEIAARCIACGGCNFACPTCSCFGVQDRTFGKRTERSRLWDSCQLDAFMREASGHNPLGTETLRTRRRIYHKLVADPLRWGEPGCVACGRCDRACPTGIGMFALCEELVRTCDRHGS